MMLGVNGRGQCFQCCISGKSSTLLNILISTSIGGMGVEEIEKYILSCLAKKVTLALISAKTCKCFLIQ